jgi:hypothetical protein
MVVLDVLHPKPPGPLPAIDAPPALMQAISTIYEETERSKGHHEDNESQHLGPSWLASSPAIQPLLIFAR